MIRIKWLGSTGIVYGRDDVDDTSDVHDALVDLLEDKWYAFGEDGDQIVIEEI